MIGSLTQHTPSSQHALSRRQWIFALSAALAATLLALAFLSWRSLFCDEYLTYYSVIKTPMEMIRTRLDSGHSPLYFFIARLGLLLGQNEVALRVTSVAALFFTLLALAGLLGTLGLTRCLVPVLVLAVCAPDWFTDGTTCRYMIFLIACAILALGAAVRYVETWSWRRGLILAAAMGLLLWIHASAQFLLAALGVFILWESRAAGSSRARTLGRVWPLLAGFTLNLPLLYLIRGHAGYLKRGLPNLADLAKNILEIAFGDYHLWPKFLNLPAWPMIVAEIAVLGAALVLARRQLLREGRPRVWRLLASVMAAIPLAMILTSLLVRNFQGPARYLTALSIPFILTFGIAWNAALTPWGRRLFRLALVLVLAAQFSGTVLCRGDRHREAVRWILEHHSGKEPIVISTYVATAAGLKLYGLKDSAVLVNLTGATKKTAVMRTLVPELTDKPPRGYFLVYFTRYQLEKAIGGLKARNFILDYRTWKISDAVTVGAFIRNEEDRAWLKGLEGPKNLWGTFHDYRVRKSNPEAGGA